MTTQETNKLIAEFMGMTNDVPHNKSMMIFKTEQGYNDVISINELQYHTSWDWLMPVVERIEEAEDLMSQEKFIRIEYDVCIIPHHKGEITEYGMTKIEATYKAVVQFIEYYNNLNK